MWNKFKNLLSNPRFTPLILLALVVVSYGLFLPLLGLYMDDWYILWFKDTFGAAQFPQYFALDRPLEGPYFFLANLLTADSISPLVWQIFTLLTHWLAVLALWGFLHTLWPKNQRQNNWVSFLAAVYPGFTQSWMIQYSFHLFCLACFFTSLLFMLKALRSPHRFWLYTLLSVLLGAYAYAGADFYAGLELIRPVVLWIEISHNIPETKARFKKLGLSALPYALAYLAFIVWRGFIFESANHKVTLSADLLRSPIQTLVQLAQKVWQAAVDALINAWAAAFNLQNYPLKGMVWWLILVFVLALGVGFYLWSRWSRHNNDESLSLRWRREAALLALVSLVTAVLPFWAAGLEVSTVYPYDRFLLAYLFGSCLLIVALLETRASYQRFNTILLCLLVAFGAGSQIANANRYKNLWAQQKDLYWQIVWRMPTLEQGTTLFTYELPNHTYQAGTALSAQLNWTYGGTDTQSRQTQYQFILLNSGQSSLVSELAPNRAIESSDRTYSFNGNTSDSVYVYKPSTGCLRVLDDDLTPLTTVVSDYNNSMFDAVSLSDLSLIGAADAPAAVPVTRIVGAEPAALWCYYFEKAELARQSADYSTVLSLLSKAQEQGLKPLTSSEWYPFIESYAQTGNWEEAAARSAQILAENRMVQQGVCHVWERLEQSYQNDAERSAFISARLSEYSCR